MTAPHRSWAGMRVSLLAVVLVVAPLAGCSGTFSGGPEFELVPDRVGWNVTDLATFTLTFLASEDAPTFEIDPVFVVESIKLDTGGVGGDFETDRPEELDFALRLNGTAVQQHVLSASSPEITLVFRLPEELKDDAYTVQVSLFKAGDIESKAFRVNRP